MCPVKHSLHFGQLHCMSRSSTDLACLALCCSQEIEAAPLEDATRASRLLVCGYAALNLIVALVTMRKLQKCSFMNLLLLHHCCRI